MASSHSASVLLWYHFWLPLHDSSRISINIYFLIMFQVHFTPPPSPPTQPPPPTTFSSPSHNNLLFFLHHNNLLFFLFHHNILLLLLLLHYHQPPPPTNPLSVAYCLLLKIINVIRAVGMWFSFCNGNWIDAGRRAPARLYGEKIKCIEAILSRYTPLSLSVKENITYWNTEEKATLFYLKIVLCVQVKVLESVPHLLLFIYFFCLYFELQAVY